MTGRHVPDTPRTVNERQRQLDAVRAKMFPPAGTSVPPAGRSAAVAAPATDDRDLLALAGHAKNGADFDALYRGQHSYGSQSEADLALCNMLAFWFGPDPARIDRAFRGSGLMRPKWDTTRGETTYGAQTIETALAGRTDFYGDREARKCHTDAAGATEPPPEQGARIRAPEPDWLTGAPMDPAGTAADPLPSLPGFPYLHAGSGAVIVGPTGGGRSALIQAGLYDAAGAGLRCAYLGCEVTESEFNARAAILAQCRGDSVTDELRESLARVRYLNLASVTAQAEQDPEAWVQGITARYAVVAIDPLSAVASALDLDFDKSNAEFIRFYDRLVQPLTTRGVTVLIVDNIGHAEDAKRRAKGASAKQDRADLTFSCSPSTSPVGLAVKAQKVRSVRAGFQRGDEWLFVKDTQRIEHRGHQEPADRPAFRPTNIMEKVSRAVEHADGLTRNAICTAIGGRKENVTLALQLLVSEGYIAAEKAGQAHHHRSVKPYREAIDPATGSTGSQPGPNRVPVPVPATGSNRVPLSVGKGPVRDPVSGGAENSNRVPPAVCGVAEQPLSATLPEADADRGECADDEQLLADRAERDYGARP